MSKFDKVCKSDGCDKVLEGSPKKKYCCTPCKERHRIFVRNERKKLIPKKQAECLADGCITKFDQHGARKYCSIECKKNHRYLLDKEYHSNYRDMLKNLSPEETQRRRDMLKESSKARRSNLFQGQSVACVDLLLKQVAANRPVFDHRCHTCGRGCANKVETITESAYELESVRLKREAKREREAWYDGVEYNETDHVKTDLHYCCQSCYDLKLTDEMVINREQVAYHSAKWRGETL